MRVELESLAFASQSNRHPIMKALSIDEIRLLLQRRSAVKMNLSQSLSKWEVVAKVPCSPA